jgi:pantoate--beta-alanine ligase
MPSTVATVRALRAALLPWRKAHETVAFVPTMGALHRGHLALVAEARKIAKRVVVSIFINPMQFAPNEDWASYPRRMGEDQILLAGAGCDLIYAPAVDEIYPNGFATYIDPGPMAAILEGAFRPTHFRGVATVVVKLLLQLLPDAALFGEKDYQQLQIIRQVVRDLNIPIHIIGAPIVRDADGLALSSRNAYLSADERKRAVALPQALDTASDAILAGGGIETVLTQGRARLAETGFTVDYLELADAATLAPLRKLGPPARLLIAARIGKTRLIDNRALASGWEGGE